MNAESKSKSAREEPDLESLSQEIEKLREDLSGLVATVGEVGRKTVMSRASRGVAKGEAALADMTSELQRIESDIVASTREAPIRALGVAALVGLVVGLILRR